MIKVIVIIEEVPEKKPEKKPEPIVGKYIITKSNYGGAYIMGIPCKIMSEPYAVKDEYHDKNIKVMSCITGIEYEIPYKPSWFKVYDTFDEVLTTTEAENLIYYGYHIFQDPLCCEICGLALSRNSLVFHCPSNPSKFSSRKLLTEIMSGSSPSRPKADKPASVCLWSGNSFLKVLELYSS